MCTPIRTKAPYAVLLLALLAGTASCRDSPFTPEELSAAQVSQLEMMLGSITFKLDSIGAQIDEQTLVFEGRIDSLEAVIAASGGGGGTTTPTGALLDSIMALTSYIAEDISTVSFEVCGGIELAGEVSYGYEAEADGRAAGDLGAWAGTGAFAGVIGWIKANVEGEIKATVPIGIGGCLPLGVGNPPLRPAPVGPLALSPESDALRTTLVNLSSQFNLDPSTLPQTLTNIAGTIQSPGSLTLQDVSSQIPLPAAFASITSDPIGTVTGRFQSLSNDAVDMLCGSTNWGSNVSSVISDACALFPGGLPNVTAFASMSTDFPIVQSTVSAVCGRLNTMGTRSLVIPSYSVNFGGVLGTWTVFPGYNQRLFPSYSSPC